MKKLTKAEAVANHRKMWNWIADETQRRGEKVKKIRYFKEMGIEDWPLYECYCCEYASQQCDINSGVLCEHCPIEWPNGRRCVEDDAPYDKWCSAVCPVKAAKLAREIAALPERKEADREKKKAEAVKRMQLLALHPNAVCEFESSDIINISEASGGFLYWASDAEKEIIRDFEERYNAVVYHVIRNRTTIGEMLSLLYVSDCEDEWDMDRDDLEIGCPIAYVKNLSDDDCSEFGSIMIEQRNGVLIRAA